MTWLMQTRTCHNLGFSPYIDEVDDEQHSLVQAQKRQQLMQLDTERDFQSALIEEREEGIKQIESTIQEVNDIFVDLATLVNEQAGMVGAFYPLVSCFCNIN